MPDRTTAVNRAVPRGAILFACAALALQAAYLAWFAWLQCERYALTTDFAVYYQAWLNVVREHAFNPRISYPFEGRLIPNLYEFLFPLTSAFALLSPSALMLKLVGAGSLLAAEVVAVRWTFDIVRGETALRGRATAIVACSAVAVGALSPWVPLALAFDYHLQPLAGLFAVLALHAFYLGKIVRGWLWIAMLSLSFIVGATYGIAIGASVAIASRRPVLGALLAVASLAYVAALGFISPNAAAGVITHNYAWLADVAPHGPFDVAGATAMHPLSALKALERQELNLYANVAPYFFLPLLCPWTAPLWLLAVVENGLAGADFARPNFQWAIVYPTAMPAFAWVVCAGIRRLPATRQMSLAAAFCAVAVVFAAGWCAVWMPTLPGAWIGVRPASAAALARAHAAMAPNVEAIVSQGVVGRFGDVAVPLAFTGSLDQRVRRAETHIVLAPLDGTETASPEQTFTTIASLLHTRAVTLISRDADVWHFRYDGAAGDALRADGAVPCVALRAARCLPAGMFPGDGRVDHDPARACSMTERTPAYAVRNVYWRRLPGTYRIVVSGRARDVVVEVHDVAEGRVIASVRGPLDERGRVLEATLDPVTRVYAFSGSGPFRTAAPAFAADRVIEVSVRLAARSAGCVTALGIAPAGAS